MPKGVVFNLYPKGDVFNLYPKGGSLTHAQGMQIANHFQSDAGLGLTSIVAARILGMQIANHFQSDAGLGLTSIVAARIVCHLSMTHIYKFQEHLHSFEFSKGGLRREANVFKQVTEGGLNGI
jgi:hypothetical protein